MSLRPSLNLSLLLGLLVTPIETRAQATWEPSQSLVKITIMSHDQYRIFDKMGMPIVDVRDHYVKALATSEQLAQVRSLGFPVEVLLKDYSKEFEEKGYPPMGTPALTGTQGWNFYHTYAQVRDSLRALALRHPTICRVESLGLSVQNRVLWGMRISDNIGVRENEPRLRITGNIHGNEHIGCEVSLYMAYMLADSYGVSSRLTQIVDEHEIFVLPMQNPDGATSNVRTNANNVDLNRDYGYMWHGWGRSPDLYSQPETHLLRQDGEANPYALSLAYHSGAECIPYPWSYTGIRTQDDLLFKRLAYGFYTYSRYDTINSYRWYQINGCSSDEAYGGHGNLEIIIEVWLRGGANNPPPESIEAVCLRNKEGVIYTLNKGRTGIHGTVTDVSIGRPIQALIRPSPLSQGQDWFLYSAKENGDFHRPVLVGTYSLKFSANGYRDTVIGNILVPDTVNPVTVNVRMTPGANYAAVRVIGVEQDSLAARTNSSLTPWILGVPDNRAYAMGRRGRIILDMGQGSEVLDGPGPDVRIVDYPNGADTLMVWAGNAWTGPWTFLGTGIGTCSLDLSGSGLSQARYVLLRDTSRYNLDAVEALNHNVGVEQGPAAGAPFSGRLTSCPNPFRTSTTISMSPGARAQEKSELSVYDAIGRLVRTIVPNPSGEYVWNGTDSKGRSLPGGVYFYRLNSPRFTATKKVVLIR